MRAALCSCPDMGHLLTSRAPSLLAKMQGIAELLRDWQPPPPAHLPSTGGAVVAHTPCRSEAAAPSATNSGDSSSGGEGGGSGGGGSGSDAAPISPSSSAAPASIGACISSSSSGGRSSSGGSGADAGQPWSSSQGTEQADGGAAQAAAGAGPAAPVEQWVVVMDCTGASTLNAARISWVFKAVASTLAHHYPGRCGGHGAPSLPTLAAARFVAALLRKHASQQSLHHVPLVAWDPASLPCLYLPSSFPQAARAGARRPAPRAELDAQGGEAGIAPRHARQIQDCARRRPGPQPAPHAAAATCG